MTVHADTDTPNITGAEIEVAGPIIKNPTPRYSIDETIDYHVILDQELDQLARPENGIVGTIGFTTLGAFLGFLPTTVAILNNISDTPTQPISLVELTTLLLTPSAGATALVCLILFSISKFRNRDLISKIRDRPRKRATST